MQTPSQSLIEVSIRKIISLVVGALFGMWWIPEVSPNFLTALYITSPFVILSFVLGYITRRIFNFLHGGRPSNAS